FFFYINVPCANRQARREAVDSSFSSSSSFHPFHSVRSSVANRTRSGSPLLKVSLSKVFHPVVSLYTTYACFAFANGTYIFGSLYYPFSYLLCVTTVLLFRDFRQSSADANTASTVAIDNKIEQAMIFRLSNFKFDKRLLIKIGKVRQECIRYIKKNPFLI
ncbi:hypothetical protein Anas_05646, partial [Armadillidium nasatum]